MLGTFLQLLLQPSLLLGGCLLPKWTLSSPAHVAADGCAWHRAARFSGGAGGVSQQKGCLQAPSFYALLQEGLCLIRLAHKGGVLSQSLDLLRAGD